MESICDVTKGQRMVCTFIEDGWAAIEEVVFFTKMAAENKLNDYKRSSIRLSKVQRIFQQSVLPRNYKCDPFGFHDWRYK